MGFTMPPVTTLVAMACAGLGLLLQVVGVATPAWAVSDDVDARSGLWQACISGTCVDIDASNGSIPDWLYACRAFGILAVLLLVGCVAAAVIACFQQIDKPLVYQALAFMAAACCLVEFSVYVDQTTLGAEASYGYSFYLTIVANVLAWVAGVCFNLRRTSS